VTTYRVGINGFGRVGRSVFRILADRDEFDVVVINDLYENEQLAYLLKYDTVMGIFPQELTVKGNEMFYGDSSVVLTSQRDPAEIPWRKYGADVVIEATGVFRLRAQLEKHLDAGAEKVILTVPAKDEIDATIVIGVNDGELRPEDRIVSNASCTTNCLAPIAKILDDAFGLAEGFVTTIHAYTNDQRLADVPHKDPRRSRAAAENVIPTTTGAARAVGRVLPKLNGRLDGLAIRVPVPDGSIVDLVVRLDRKTSRDEINAAVRDAANGPLKQIVEYTEEPLVSSDIIGNPHSAIFDARSTRTLGGHFAKVISWYDNEWGYAMRVVDLIERVAGSG